MNNLYDFFFTQTVETQSPFLIFISLGAIAATVFFLSPLILHLSLKLFSKKEKPVLWDNQNDNDSPLGI